MVQAAHDRRERVPRANGIDNYTDFNTSFDRPLKGIGKQGAGPIVVEDVGA